MNTAEWIASDETGDLSMAMLSIAVSKGLKEEASFIFKEAMAKQLSSSNVVGLVREFMKSDSQDVLDELPSWILDEPDFLAYMVSVCISFGFENMAKGLVERGLHTKASLDDEFFFVNNREIRTRESLNVAEMVLSHIAFPGIQRKIVETISSALSGDDMNPFRLVFLIRRIPSLSLCEEAFAWSGKVAGGEIAGGSFSLLERALFLKTEEPVVFSEMLSIFESEGIDWFPHVRESLFPSWVVDARSFLDSEKLKRKAGRLSLPEKGPAL